MGRECKQTDVNEKQLTSFPCRGKNRNSIRSIRCSSVYIFNSASRGGGTKCEDEMERVARGIVEGRGVCKGAEVNEKQFIIFPLQW